MEIGVTVVVPDGVARDLMEELGVSSIEALSRVIGKADLKFHPQEEAISELVDRIRGSLEYQVRAEEVRARRARKAARAKAEMEYREAVDRRRADRTKKREEDEARRKMEKVAKELFR
jgi:hypothetical protein